MSRYLSADQIRNLNILSAEMSGDDSGDDSEIDMVEADLNREDSDELIEEEDEEIESNSLKNIHPKGLVSQDINTLNNDISNSIILGRINKTSKNSAFQWYEKPNETFTNNSSSLNSRIIDDLKEETSIIIFFKQLSSIDIVAKIVKHTNKRISLIENQGC